MDPPDTWSEQTSLIGALLTSLLIAGGILAGAVVYNHSSHDEAAIAMRVPVARGLPPVQLAEAMTAPATRYVYFVGSEDDHRFVQLAMSGSGIPVADQDIVVVATREEADSAVAEVESGNVSRVASGQTVLQAVAVGTWPVRD